MLVVGLVGGIASGKSRVADFFAARGATVIHADVVGHQVLLEPAIKQEIFNRWGESVFNVNGDVNRSAVAELVFADSSQGRAELRFLESLVHPEIRRRLQSQLRQAEQQGAEVVVLDAPVLFEAGWDEICHEILFIDADATQRLRRGLSRGWTERMFRLREKSQIPVDVKRQKSTCQVDNSGTWDDTMRQLTRLWNLWTSDSTTSGE